MTKHLYDTSPYLHSFKATVTSVGTDDGKSYAVLDETAFFPEQGGQYSDHGTIGGIRCYDVQITGGEIRHYTDSLLEVGREYDCEIDFAERFGKMQNHTGEHIVSGLVHRHFGLDNVGFHLGCGDVTMDYNGVLDREQLNMIEDEANRAVSLNLDVICEYPSPERLAEIEYRSKLELKENVRIVTIPGYDVCACCAPHVAKTGEIGIIKLLDFQKYKGGTRVHMLCGFDALADYRKKYEAVRAIALELTAKQDEVRDAVDRIIAENAELRYQLTEARREAIKLRTQTMEPTDGNTVIFLDGADGDMLRETVNEALSKTGGMCAALSRKGDGYQYVIGSHTVDMSAKAKEINLALGGRGGGKKEMIMGSLTASEDEIRAYFGN